MCEAQWERRSNAILRSETRLTAVVTLGALMAGESILLPDGRV